jgi:hypothetical protein
LAPQAQADTHTHSPPEPVPNPDPYTNNFPDQERLLIPNETISRNNYMKFCEISQNLAKFREIKYNKILQNFAKFQGISQNFTKLNQFRGYFVFREIKNPISRPPYPLPYDVYIADQKQVLVIKLWVYTNMEPGF